ALGREPRAAFALLPMARPSQVESRLRAILNDQERRARLSRGLLVIAGVLVLALLLPVAALDPVARPPAPSPQPLPPAPAPLAPPAPLASSEPPSPSALAPTPPPASPVAPAAAPAPRPEPAPAPAPDPEPELWSRAEAKRAVVFRLGPTGSSVRPSPAEVAQAVARVRERVRRDARDRLDAAFAYEMRDERAHVRVDVGRLLADLDDVEAWDAADRRSQALAAQLDAMTEDAERWGGLAWI